MTVNIPYSLGHGARTKTGGAFGAIRPPQRPHAGIDFSVGGQAGIPVGAAVTGTVIFNGNARGYGPVVVVQSEGADGLPYNTINSIKGVSFALLLEQPCHDAHALSLAGIPQHIVQRGINREPCFFADEDYHCYLHWLEKAAGDWHCAIPAYVLMTNHVHLLLTAETAEGIARMMQAMGRRYVQYINRSYRRTGSLWEGRYKSSLVQAETYLLTCMRYIELNPVRAGMVDDPSQYRWSSYRHNGLGQADTRITHHPLYPELGADVTTRQAAYRALFRSQLDDDAIADIRLALLQGQPLGSDRFSDAMCAAVGIRRSRKRPGRPAASPDQTSSTETQPDFGF